MNSNLNDKKILINVPNIKLSGGVANLYKVLNLKGYKNIEYFYIKSRKNIPVFLLLPFKLIHFLIKIIPFDIVHINPSFDRNAIIRDGIFLFISKLFSKKVIIFNHGWEDDFEKKIISNRFNRWLFCYFYNKADAFILLGDIFKKKLINIGINPSKKFFIETTIADDTYINDFNLNNKITSFKKEEHIIKFLFISRIVKGKGMELAIEIFIQLQKTISNKINLIFAGEGDMLDKTKEYVKEKNVKNVDFIGYVVGKEKNMIYMDADILILTSESEGLPSVILEGMLYGLPIITTDVGAISDWVKNNENGFITNSRKAVEFVMFIEKLIKDKELYTKIARNNHEKALKYFTKDKIRERLFNIYNETLN